MPPFPIDNVSQMELFVEVAVLMGKISLIVKISFIFFFPLLRLFSCTLGEMKAYSLSKAATNGTIHP